MKKIYKTLPALLVMAFAGWALTACGSGQPQTETAQEQSQAKVMDVDALLADAENLVDKDITVEGICTHICARGGGKLFMMGSDDTKTIRVEAGEKIGKFTQEVVNRIVTINGTMREQRIDEAFLSRWEEQAKGQETETHGENGAGCDAEQNAHGQSGLNSTTARIADYRTKIAERQAKEGKAYLSFYYIDGDSYTIHE